MKTNILVIVILIVVVGPFAYCSSKYILKDDDQVVITQFGKAIGSKNVPGVYFKIPVIQKVQYLTKRYCLAEWEQLVPTFDKQYLLLKTKVFWKITNPILFYKRLNHYKIAQDFVIKQVGDSEKEYIISHTYSDLAGIVDDKELKGVECNHNIKQIFLENVKESISQCGISLNNIEVKAKTVIINGEP